MGELLSNSTSEANRFNQLYFVDGTMPGTLPAGVKTHDELFGEQLTPCCVALPLLYLQCNAVDGLFAIYVQGF